MVRREKSRLKTFVADSAQELEKQYNEWADTLPDNAIITYHWTNDEEIWGGLYPRAGIVMYVTYEIGADKISRGSVKSEGYLQ